MASSGVKPCADKETLLTFSRSRNNVSGRCNLLRIMSRIRLVVTSLAKHNCDLPVVISGAGIAGLASAVALHKEGFHVQVLETAPTLRQEGTAIGLWDNAWKALDSLGVAGGLRTNYSALDKVELCQGPKGRLLKHFSFSDCEGGAGSEFRAVHRSALLEALADSLPPETISFGTSVLSFSQQAEQPNAAATASNTGHGNSGTVPNVLAGVRDSMLRVRVQKGSVQEDLDAAILVGADGVRSAVAQQLGMPLPNYSGYSAYRGVATLGQEGVKRVGLPAGTIRQIWGAGVRAGVYQLNDSELYWFVCFNADLQSTSDAPEQHLQKALALVKGWSWSLENIIQSTSPDQVSRSRCVDRWTLSPWGKGQVTLTGDAAHPMTPNLGQGGCTALEDAILLAAVLRPLASLEGQPSEGKVSTALRKFEQLSSARCLPLTVRSNLMGAALQLEAAPITLARDAFVGSTLFSPAHFLDHAKYDLHAAVMRAQN
ncbi:hypothetical protein CEUSTIGMA_g401.t1 [Chlamydomonas eustigma]|uniref:FAD-binding domain-containing protein n=1 Tax=Chlamydomonas eustigma TaxID=1157962 RepID=A0A250WQH3_9CHLO|nr:hypothetical protein CEUSTIGMA_g401.t1 [Chlamydomonas eustigma]|eukprot:GAX72946.1 hypothetical protein CEUSTIGMA_g401.t1 [Chlamydomonas eustigma]